MAHTRTIGFVSAMVLAAGAATACPLDGPPPLWVWYVLPAEYEPVIEGEARELVPLEGDEVEVGEGSAGSGEPVRGVELARLLLGDRSVDDPDGWGRMARLERVGAAIGLYGMHLRETPGDLIASRELALALLETKDAAGAADRMLEAYTLNPGLGVIPIDGGLLGEDGSRMRTLVVRAVRHAHRVGGADAWLLASVLMQAEARFDAAAGVLDRAEAAGLDPEVVRSVRDGLGVSP